MDLCSVSDIKALLARHGFRFSKSMGQNFLIDARVPRDIAAASGADGTCGVLEIGPGIGPLTAELARRAARVVAVELDRSLLPILSETLGEFDNVEIVPGDVLKLDLAELVGTHFAGLTPMVCANLPYNVTTPVLTTLIACGQFAAVTVMIQREVALRICAAPGTPDYGAFSVYCQYHTAPELLFEVPSDCFLPAPKVTSAVLRMVPRAKPEGVDDEEFFFRTVRGAFAQRRKTLVNSLSACLGAPFTRERIARAIADCGFAADVRGERLGIPEFAALCAALQK